MPVGAYEDFPGAGGYPDGRLWACVGEVGDGKGGVAEVEGYWLSGFILGIFAFGYREEGADLADAFAGLYECVAGDAFAGAEWPCEEDAVKEVAGALAMALRAAFGVSWPITSLKVCGRCAVAVFWAVP